MGWFNKSKKQEAPVEKPAKMVIGVSPELVNEVKSKVGKLKKEKEGLQKDYNDLIERLADVEAKCEAIDKMFSNFKTDLQSDFLEEARKELKKEMKSTSDGINNNHTRLMKMEDELIKVSKMHDEFEFVSSFQDYYQLIKLCIYMITNAEPEHLELITLVLQTVHSLVDDMRRNGFWDAGKDAIITSLLNLKTYWRGRDERVEQLIGAEISALEMLR